MISSFANPLYRHFQQLNALLIRSVPIALQINQLPAISAPHAPFYTIHTAIIFALFAFFAANIYTIYMFYTAQTLSPRRRAVCGDDSLPALESLGDNETKVLG